MKNRAAIAFLGLCLLVLLLYWLTTPGPEPALVFVRYAQMEVDHSWFAELHLTNNTRHVIGYKVNGLRSSQKFTSEYFMPEYFYRVSSSTGSNTVVNDVGILLNVNGDDAPKEVPQIIEIFMASMKPGTFAVLRVPVEPGASPKQAGIDYYELADPANTFSGQLYRLSTRVRFALKMKDTRGHEIWCPELLSVPSNKQP